MQQDLPDSNTLNHTLGEYTAILVADVHHFSKHNTAQQQKITTRLPEILSQAANRAHTTDLWKENRFRAFRGDGYLVGLQPDLVAAVVDRFFDSLQNELRRCSVEFQAHGIELRLRLSLHLGPVQSFDAPLCDSPNDAVMVDSRRMVDAESVRALLDNSDPNVTFVAGVLSQTVMEHAVQSGQTIRQPSEFVEAPLRVAAKDYSGTGHLRVPAPSGQLLSSGLLHGQPEQDSTEAPQHQSIREPLVSNTVTGHAENVNQAQAVHGGIHNNSSRENGTRLTITGDGNVASTDNSTVDQSTASQEFSGTFVTQGDSNFGQSSGRRAGSDDSAGR